MSAFTFSSVKFEERWFAFLKKKNWNPPFSVLQGDGSNRVYLRVGEAPHTRIAMILADPDPHKQAEEIGDEVEDKELPFLAIHKLFQKHQLPVPAIYEYDRDLGILLLEDLGDTLLSHLFQDGFPQRYYEVALEYLLRILNLPEEKNLLFKRRFSLSLLVWEFLHFVEYGGYIRMGKEVDGQEMDWYSMEFSRLLEPLTTLYYPVHRDYHSRNLMVDKEGKLRIIDFQDALLGSPYYDLVSLLYDAYVDIPPLFREKWKEDMKKEIRTLRTPFVWEDPQYYLMAVHRMLKAAGRFVYFDRVKGKPHYLNYIPSLLARVRNIQEEIFPVFPETLWNRLRELVPEWQ
jgi:hypothetical protein